MKYFLEVGTEFVFPLSTFKGMLEDRDENKEIILEEHIRDVSGEFLWCDEYGDFMDTKESCGKVCEDYSPCNGKSGRCRFLKQGFVGTGRYFTLTKRGKVCLRENAIIK